MIQLDLNLSGDDRIQANFEKFHAENPRVYQLFCRFTQQMRDSGCEHGGAKMIAERIRWETGVVTTSNPPVKLNNNYTSRYARMWMRDYRVPDFFRTRELAASNADSVLGAALHYAHASHRR